MSATILSKTPNFATVPVPISLIAAEVGERGRVIYTEEIQALVEPQHLGKVLTLDIFSHDYEIGTSLRETLQVLKLRCPEGRFYTVRIGAEAYGRV